MTTTQTTEYASCGAVGQHDGPLPIRRCNTCGAEIVFPTSKRTGRRYPVSVTRGYLDQRFYMGHNVHRCEPVVEVRTYTQAQLRFAALMPVAQWDWGY